MTAFFENDPQRFLGYIANHTYQDDELTELNNIYRRLSPFSKGMLIEKRSIFWKKKRRKKKVRNLSSI